MRSGSSWISSMKISVSPGTRGLVSHEREACYEIRYIGGLSQRALRRLIEVEIDCQKALILLATQALYQIAFTDLARTCHEKCCLTTSGRPTL